MLTMACSTRLCARKAELQARHWEVLCPVCQGPTQHLLTDEAQVRPHNQYAMSKFTQEMIGLNLGKRYGIPGVGMRYSIAQGPRQSFRNAYSGICRIFVTRMLAGQQPVAYEDGGQFAAIMSMSATWRTRICWCWRMIGQTTRPSTSAADRPLRCWNMASWWPMCWVSISRWQCRANTASATPDTSSRTSANSTR